MCCLGLSAASQAVADCPFNWDPGVGMPGVNGPVYATAVYDDGSGPALYIGGSFSIAGTAQVNNLAKWNGTAWSSVGNGVSGSPGIVSALAVYNGELIVGGTFSGSGGLYNNVKNIARWNGTTWTALGTGTGSSVLALTIYNGELIAGGAFTGAGGVSGTFAIARWNGTSWASLGGGSISSGSVMSLAVFNNKLVAGGSFGGISGTPVSGRIGCWDGTSWTALGTGTISNVNALAVFNNELIAGGKFSSIGGVSGTSRIGRWNGTSWAALAAGVNEEVDSLTVWGNQLYAGGLFTAAGAISAKYMARWNGTTWSAVGSGTDSYVYSTTIYNGQLIAGGDFNTAGGLLAAHLARWDGTNWLALGGGLNGTVNALATYGTDLIAGTSKPPYIVKRSGGSWVPLGGGMDSDVNALAIYNGDLIAGGAFTTAGGVTVNKIARWNGTSWSSLASGASTGSVLSLAVYNGDLIAGGTFLNMGGGTARYIAKWNGSSWASLGDNITGCVGSPCFTSVWAMSIYNNELVAGGNFTHIGGIANSGISRWNGTSWSSLGTGITTCSGTGCSPIVYALAAYNNQLVAAGRFLSAGGVTVSNIARWDGSAWSAMGGGTYETILSLLAYNNVLVAGGQFTVSGYFGYGTVELSRIAWWDGTTWRSVDAGISGCTKSTPFASCTSSVNALTLYDNDLFAGGNFSTADNAVSPYAAQLHLAPDSDGDFITDACDNCPSRSNTLQLDCDLDGKGDACEIADGDSPDCNNNGLPDTCELSRRLLVSSRDSDAVLAYNAVTGAYIGEAVAPGTGGLDFPNGIEVDAAGHIYVASVNTNAVIEYSARGQFIRQFAGNGLDGPVQPRISGSWLLVSNFSGNNVVRFDLASGAPLTPLVIAGSGGLDGAAGMLIKPDGKLLVVSQHNDKVLEYDGQTGAFVRVAAQSTDPYPFMTPADVVLDDQGNLLITAFNSSLVARYAPNGAPLAPLVPLYGGVNSPEGLIRGLNGHLFVADLTANGVLEFDAVTGAPIDHDAFAAGAQPALTRGALNRPTYLTITLADSDCDHNGVPDNCQPDSDGDSIVDACDNCPALANIDQADADHDGVGDVCDACPNTTAGLVVDANGCPLAISGDFDGDGDVDTADVNAFKACAKGTGVPIDPNCSNRDFDHDGDADHDDFSVVQRCYSGANHPGNPHCAG